MNGLSAFEQQSLNHPMGNMNLMETNVHSSSHALGYGLQRPAIDSMPTGAIPRPWHNNNNRSRPQSPVSPQLAQRVNQGGFSSPPFGSNSNPQRPATRPPKINTAIPPASKARGDYFQPPLINNEGLSPRPRDTPSPSSPLLSPSAYSQQRDGELGIAPTSQRRFPSPIGRSQQAMSISPSSSSPQHFPSQRSPVPQQMPSSQSNYYLPDNKQYLMGGGRAPPPQTGMRFPRPNPGPQNYAAGPHAQAPFNDGNQYGWQGRTPRDPINRAPYPPDEYHNLQRQDMPTAVHPNVHQPQQQQQQQFYQAPRSESYQSRRPPIYRVPVSNSSPDILERQRTDYSSQYAPSSNEANGRRMPEYHEGPVTPLQRVDRKVSGPRVYSQESESDPRISVVGEQDVVDLYLEESPYSENPKMGPPSDPRDASVSSLDKQRKLHAQKGNYSDEMLVNASNKVGHSRDEPSDATSSHYSSDEDDEVRADYPDSKDVPPKIRMKAFEKIKRRAFDAPGDVGVQIEYARALMEAVEHLSDDENPKIAAQRRELWNREAYKILKSLTSHNHPEPEALYLLGAAYGNGALGFQENSARAFDFYMRAAQLNHPKAAYRVAASHEIGAGPKRDQYKALKWYKRAAELGDKSARYKLGLIHLNGLLGQQRSSIDGIQLIKECADSATRETAHFLHEMGLIYEKGSKDAQLEPNPQLAYESFLKAAKWGYPPSQFRLGSIYEYGLLNRQSDIRKSLAWFCKGAENGDPDCELALSGWYLTGVEGFITQSDREAYLWARRAAEKGSARAEYALGYYSEIGVGTKTSIEQAKLWYFKAADQNHPKAQQRLAALRSAK